VSHRDFQTTVLLRSDESGGHVALVENTVPGGWEGPPLHHHDFDEAFYVLDGELTFALGDERLTAGPGALVFAPRGAPHTLAALGGAGARYLLVITPAGFERYFDRIAAEQAGVEPPASALGPIPETIVVGPALGGPATRTAPTAQRGRVNVLLRGAQTAKQVAVMDNTVGADAQGPPLHYHDFDEAFYVVEGELTFQLGDELFTRGPGELAFAPRGARHAFANPNPEDARTVLVCTPAGFEPYFDRIAARQAGVDPPPEALGPLPEVVTVGPRISDRADTASAVPQ
jgi:quercetin dioxygenase-like cupin family protein